MRIDAHLLIYLLFDRSLEAPHSASCCDSTSSERQLTRPTTGWPSRYSPGKIYLHTNTTGNRHRIPLQTVAPLIKTCCHIYSIFDRRRWGLTFDLTVWGVVIDMIRPVSPLMVLAQPFPDTQRPLLCKLMQVGFRDVRSLSVQPGINPELIVGHFHLTRPKPTHQLIDPTRPDT